MAPGGSALPHRKHQIPVHDIHHVGDDNRGRDLEFDNPPAYDTLTIPPPIKETPGSLNSIMKKYWGGKGTIEGNHEKALIEAYEAGRMDANGN